MRGDPRSQEQRQRFMAYMSEDGAPAEARGRVMLAMFAHAFVYLLLTAAEASWVVAVAVRVWRRREAGMTTAMRTGAHKPTLAVLLAAQLAYVILRRAGLAKLNRRVSEYTAQRGPA
jgi:hypothetical protein